MSARLELQRVSQARPRPTRAAVQRWVDAALVRLAAPAALTVRLVDTAEGQQLNRAFRGIDRATNVLSFPFERLPGMPQRRRQLGDVIVCSPLVLAEAAAQGKSAEAHYAHLIVHGVLHLIGFDHQEQEQAARMEALETEILTGLGYPDPYRSQD
jgi:probable rRNA maturation factor